MSFRKTLGTILGSLLMLAMCVGVAAGIYWYKQHQKSLASKKPPPPEVPESVSIESVTMLEYRPSTTAVGTVVAPRWMSLRSEVSGKIAAIHVESGATVAEGQTLIELDSSLEKPSLKAAQARQEIAYSSLRRIEKSFASDAISEQEMEQAKAELAYADAEVQRLEALIAKKTMIAPYAARVGLINVSIGQYLNEGLELTTLQGITDHVFIDFTLPQKIAGKLRLDQRVEIELLEKTAEAKVIAWDSRSDKVTRNMMVRARLDDPPSGILPNDSVKVMIEYGESIQAPSVPVSAVLRSPSGTQVFVVAKDDKGTERVAPRIVKTGSTVDQKVIVLDGLKTGDRIVSSGAFKLRQGLAVRDSKQTITTADEPTQASKVTNSATQSDIQKASESTAPQATSVEGEEPT